MRTDRLLHLGTGLLALSLLMALAFSQLRLEPDAWSAAVASLLGWVQQVTLVGGVGLLVGHLVVGALTPPEPSIEEQFRDWYDES